MRGEPVSIAVYTDLGGVRRRTDKKQSGPWKGKEEAEDSLKSCANLTLLQKVMFAMSVVGDAHSICHVCFIPVTTD